MKMKKMFALALAGAMMLTAVSCGGDTGSSSSSGAPSSTPSIEENKGDVGKVDETVTYAETFVIANHADLDSADPYGSNSSAMKVFTNITFDLGTFNNPDTGEIEPRLCTEWTDVNGDGMSWDFKLRDDVVFHDGSKFTAEDMKFTWEYTAAGAGNVINGNANAIYVDSIEVIEPYLVRFNLTTTMFDWPSYMEQKIYSKTAFDNMPAEKAGYIGSGPYMYAEDKHISGVSFTAVRNENYWGGVENYASKNIVFKVLPEADTRVAALQSGEVDMIYGDLPASYFSILSADSNLNVLTRTGSNSYYMGFNHRKALFQDLTVRKALSMAISREDIEAVAMLDGIGGIANDNFCISTGAGYSPDAHAPAYDYEAADKMLKDAGKTGLTLTLGHTSSTKSIAEVVQANLEMLDSIEKVTLRQVDSTNWTAFKRGDEFDLFTDYAGYQGALIYNYNRFFNTKGSSNFYNYSSADYDALEAEVLGAGSYENMIVKFADLQQFVVEDLPICPLVVGNQIGATRKGVEGVQLAPGTTYMNFATARKIA